MRGAGYESLFTDLAKQYSKHRFGYPPELYEFLSETSLEHDLAWDCATGSGQAATSLAKHFRKVLATDANAEQIENAHQHKNVEYVVCPAERSVLSDESVDLLTVAQALHWFDLDAFYKEAQRVLKPGGVIAVWCYNKAETDREIKRVVRELSNGILGPYWSDRVRLVENDYRTIRFPFEEIEAPTFSATTVWKEADFIGYLSSWSAVKTYLAANGHNALDTIAEELRAAWGDPEEAKTFTWPLPMRVGRKIGK